MVPAQLADRLDTLTDLGVLEQLITSFSRTRTDVEARAALEAVLGTLF